MSTEAQHHSDGHGDHGEGHGVHVSPTSTYALILLALVILTVVTAWVAFYDFGWANDIVALGIAFTKASLVVAFFMHVKYSGRIIKLVVASALSWLFIMLALTYIDYGTRNSVEADPVRVESEYQRYIDEGYDGPTASAAAGGGHSDDGEHGGDAEH